jgi:flagellar basal-body rod modification protein FlgD
MAVDNVTTQTSVGVDGNSYTTAVSNDQLTNEDFLQLMIAELQNQDPTEPMDSQRMLDNQMQMSTIQANIDMTEAMNNLQQSYANSALSNAADLIGKTIENGETNDEGISKSFYVETIENVDGELYVNGRQATGIVDGLMNAETEEIIKYDANGYFYKIDSETTKYQLVLDNDGRFTYDDDGNIQLNDENGDLITDTEILDDYGLAGSAIDYSTELTQIPLSSVIKVRG